MLQILAQVGKISLIRTDKDPRNMNNTLYARKALVWILIFSSAFPLQTLHAMEHYQRLPTNETYSENSPSFSETHANLVDRYQAVLERYFRDTGSSDTGAQTRVQVEIARFRDRIDSSDSWDSEVTGNFLQTIERLQTEGPKKENTSADPASNSVGTTLALESDIGQGRLGIKLDVQEILTRTKNLREAVLFGCFGLCCAAIVMTAGIIALRQYPTTQLKTDCPDRDTFSSCCRLGNVDIPITYLRDCPTHYTKVNLSPIVTLNGTRFLDGAFCWNGTSFQCQPFYSRLVDDKKNFVLAFTSAAAFIALWAPIHCMPYTNWNPFIRKLNELTDATQMGYASLLFWRYLIPSDEQSQSQFVFNRPFFLYPHIRK